MSSGKATLRVFAGMPLLFSLVGVLSCGQPSVNLTTSSSCTNATQNPSSSLQTTSNSNIIPVYIADSAVTGSVGYENEPLVSVTICTPNHTSASQCQTISNILLDTGSYGLRVFSSAIASNVSPEQVTVEGGTKNLAECATFGTGADWGNVALADVELGDLTASAIPIQVINYNFSSIPSACKQQSPDTDPCSAGYNGILGVGLFAQDCGPDCDSAGVISGLYYGCTSSGCTDVDGNVPTTSQLTNPITAFGSGYNNGMSLTLPSVGSGGNSQVSGSATIGIAANAGVSVYPSYSTHYDSDFRTVFISNSSTLYGSGNPSVRGASEAFIDSGSNAYFIPQAAGLIFCSSGSGFYCPTSTLSLQAEIQGYSGSPSTGTINFSIANADSLFNTNNSAFSNLGASISDSTQTFDWGLPFFYGRTIYIGIDGSSAVLGGSTVNGPYWAM